MRYKPETILIVAMSVFALTGAVAMALQETGRPSHAPEPAVLTTTSPVVDDAGDAEAWFRSVRPFCNAVEVDTRLKAQPAPPTMEGSMRAAACYALAGRVDRARQVIDGMPEALRQQAAGRVFEAAHPAADAGDDLAAGPVMELVLEYWPTHYMALYHAGAARFERGDYDVAKGYLERFLSEYATRDGWRSNAVSMLKEIDER